MTQVWTIEPVDLLLWIEISLESPEIHSEKKILQAFLHAQRVLSVYPHTNLTM